MSGSGNLTNVIGPLVQHIDEDRRRREEIQKPSYFYPADYSPPSTNVPNSDIPTPRRRIEAPHYTQATSIVPLSDPSSTEMRQHWDDYRNRGIIYNTTPRFYDRETARWEKANQYFPEFHLSQGRNMRGETGRFFNNSLMSDLPPELKPITTNLYTRNKKLLKDLARDPRQLIDSIPKQRQFFKDYIAPLGGKFANLDHSTMRESITAVVNTAPTFLANKKLEKLGSSERLPYGAALHPDTFHDIMGISTRRFRESQAQAQAQQTPTPTPASTSQARAESGSAVITTTPASTSTARQQDNIVPGFNEITAYDPSRVTRSNSATSLSTSNTSTNTPPPQRPSTPAGAKSPGSLVTGGSIFGTEGITGSSFAQTRNPSNTTSSSTSGTNTTRRLEQNLQSRIYSLTAPGYLNFENPYPIHGDMQYPARTLDAKRNPTVAQGNLATQLNALNRRDLNSVAYDDARTNVQIESNIHTALDNQKKQLSEISEALKSTLGPKRLQGLEVEEIAKSISTPRSYHYLVQRDSGFIDPNSNDPRVVRGHQVILEHRKINKRGAMKTKGFEIVQAPDHGQALLAIKPKQHLLAQYIENENYKSRDKQITAIQRNLSKFIRNYNRQSVGNPSDVHAANQANRAAVVRTANTLAKRVSYDDYMDILGKMLRTPRGNY